MNGHDIGLPIEQFIQALTSQLDRAQAALALKARAGLPLTFAVKDLTLDLRTHVEMTGSVVRIRPAGPNEGDASTIRLQLTTITRPMIEENSVAPAAQTDEPSLREVLGPEVTEDEERRLEWAGIHNVSQLRDLERRSGEQAIEKFTQLPIGRLRSALVRASLPRIVRVTPELAPVGEGNGHAPKPPLETPPAPARMPPVSRFQPERIRPDLRSELILPGPRPGTIPEISVAPIFPAAPVDTPSIAPPSSVSIAPSAPSVSRAPFLEQPSIAAPVAAPPLLRISGVNLLRGLAPTVTIQGERVPVVKANEKEIVVAPHPHLFSGTLAVEVEPGVVTEFQLPARPAASPAVSPEKGGQP